MATKYQDTKVTTGVVRFSYVHVFEPDSMGDNAEKKYSVALLIDKKDEVSLSKIQAAVDAAVEALKRQLGGKLPTKVKLPLNDGDEKDDEAYQGHWYLNARSTRRPVVVDKKKEPIFDPEELYSGCYGRASVTFFPFNVNGNRGVGCALNNVQKLRDGERLAGGSDPNVDFGGENEYVGDDDDELM